VAQAVTVIRTEKDRREAADWLAKAPIGSRVWFKGPTRTLPQNDRMWAMLTDIVKQGKEIDGRKFTTEEWKAIFLEALGHEQRFLPSLDGLRFVPLGQSSAALTIPEMTDLIEYMFAWGAENNVRWSDPALRGYEEMRR
jgi:hypothetical protein